MKNYHLTNKSGEWRFSKENTSESIETFETKEAGVNYAQDYMNKNGGSLKIHNMDGKIEEERTYPQSADPSNSPG